MVYNIVVLLAVARVDGTSHVRAPIERWTRGEVGGADLANTFMISRSHPTVGVALVGSIVSEVLSS